MRETRRLPSVRSSLSSLSFSPPVIAYILDFQSRSSFVGFQQGLLETLVSSICSNLKSVAYYFEILYAGIKDGACDDERGIQGPLFHVAVVDDLSKHREMGYAVFWWMNRIEITYRIHYLPYHSTVKHVIGYSSSTLLLTRGFKFRYPVRVILVHC